MASGSGSRSSSVVAWIYINGHILQTQLEGYIYDKPVAKQIKLDSSMNYSNLCDILYLKLRIDRDEYGLKMYFRCKNPDDGKFSIVPIDDDDDVELMFGVVISKGPPFFVEIYLEKISNNQIVDSSSRGFEGQTSGNMYSGGYVSSSIVEVLRVVTLLRSRH